MTDLFVMINCIFTEAFLPNTRYLIDKLFYPKNSLTLHAICSKCGAGMGKFDRKNRFIKCKLCKTVIKVKDKSYKDFFVMLDIGHPISKLIESNSDYYDYIVNKRVFEKGPIRDIYDGRKYQKFLSELDKDCKNSYASVVFNTDGHLCLKATLLYSTLYGLFFNVKRITI